jgi:hypothetical protein
MEQVQAAIVCILFFTIIFSGCEKNPSGGQGELRLMLTDSPAGYDEVNIVVREVAVHSTSEGWIIINDSVRTFDLLKLTNGAMTLLGDAKLDAGHYTQIRLILDEGSNVVVNGVTHPLTIPSGFRTGVKLLHEFNLQEDFTYELMLDFDANRSVKLLGNGSYQMKPVIRVHPVALSGAITGTILPVNARAELTAIAGTDTATAYADTVSGWFKLIALPPASYTLYVAPADELYADSVLSGVAVTAGQVTDIGTIVLPLK